MRYGLLVPASEGESLPLLKTTLIPGHRPECDVVIPLKSVFGQDCKLEFVDQIRRVIDFDRHNGVGGRRCHKARIMPGQVLHVDRQPFHMDCAQPGRQQQEAGDFSIQLLHGSDPDVDMLATVMETRAKQKTTSKT